MSLCGNCAGKGFVRWYTDDDEGKDTCPSCDGTGQSKEEINVNIETVYRIAMRHVNRDKWSSGDDDNAVHRDWSGWAMADRVVWAASFRNRIDRKKGGKVDLIFLVDDKGVWGVARTLGVIDVPVSLMPAEPSLATRMFVVDISGVPKAAVDMIGSSKPYSDRGILRYGLLVDGRFVMDKDERRRPLPMGHAV